MNAHDAQLGLARIWSIGAIIIFLAIAVIGINVGQIEVLTMLYGWFAPHVMPTLTVMLTVPIHDALANKKDSRVVPEASYGTLKWGSIFYLSVIFGTLLARSFLDSNTLSDFLVSTGYWLGPIQALVLAMLGLLFKSIEQN